MKIALANAARDYLEDRLFNGTAALEGSHAGNTHWLIPFTALRQAFNEIGWEIHTSDVLGFEKADIVLFFDLPTNYHLIRDFRLAHPTKPFITFLWETPLFREYAYNPANHRSFDAILTSDRTLIDNRRYFPFQLPNPNEISLNYDLSFEERGECCLISTHKNISWRSNLGHWRGKRAVGWKFSFAQTFRALFQSGELYSKRESFVRVYESLAPKALGLYGSGWSAVSASASGPLQTNKLDILSRYRFNLAYENCINRHGYISEKIFDAFIAGSVPIYLGEDNVSDFIDPDAFVDSRRFSCEKDLIKYIRTISSAEWQKIRNAGRDYLRSSRSYAFSTKAFVEAVTVCLKHVKSQRGI